MTLQDRLKSSLAAALMQNSPLAAVRVDDLRAAIERVDPEGVWMRETMAHEQRLVDKLNADAALFRELDRTFSTNHFANPKNDDLWRRVAEEAKR